MSITIKPVEGLELHCHYAGQHQPQPCYIELACGDQELSAGYNPEIGSAVPSDVWHDRVLRWHIPALRAAAANALMERIKPLAERVVAGYESTWNGSNWVGRYTDDAEAAQDEIADICQSYDDPDEELKIWNAGDWYQMCTADLQAEITPGMTDADLEAMAERLDNEGIEQCDDCDGIEGTFELLKALRDAMRSEADDD